MVVAVALSILTMRIDNACGLYTLTHHLARGLGKPGGGARGAKRVRDPERFSWEDGGGSQGGREGRGTTGSIRYSISPKEKYNISAYGPPLAQTEISPRHYLMNRWYIHTIHTLIFPCLSRALEPLAAYIPIPGGVFRGTGS